MQYFPVWRDLAKSALRSFLGIVLLRNEGKKGEQRFYFAAFNNSLHRTIFVLYLDTLYFPRRKNEIVCDILNYDWYKSVPKPLHYTVTNWLMLKCSR